MFSEIEMGGWIAIAVFIAVVGFIIAKVRKKASGSSGTGTGGGTDSGTKKRR